jgi:hypothetical protein
MAEQGQATPAWLLYRVGRLRESQGDLKGAEAAYAGVQAAYPTDFWTQEAAFALQVLAVRRELGR